MTALTPKRFETLDSLRGICALLVVCYHVRILLSFTEARFFRSGFLFVEFFFVLSGFVMYHTYGKTSSKGILQSKTGFTRYITSRFFRLYPMHLFTLIILLLIQCVKWWLYNKGSITSPPFTGDTRLSGLLPNLLLLQAWLPQASSGSFNSVAWSISIEFYLYILFGLVVLWIPRWKSFFFAVIMLVAFILLLLPVTLLKEEAFRGLSCFFAGCLCYKMYEKLALMNKPRLLFTVLECLVIVAVVLVVTWSDGFYVAHKAMAASLVFCVAIIIFAPEAGAVSAFLQSKPFSFLGKLSYSIYMIHLMTWSLCQAVAAKLGFHFTIIEEGNTHVFTTHHFFPDQALFFTVIILVILFSRFTYQSIEIKGIALGRRLRK